MNKGRVELHGLTELRRAISALPHNLAKEAAAIVTARAEEAKAEIVAAYPTGPTGNLKAGVTVQRSHSQYVARAIVRSRAKHSHLFEYGTQIRRTASGANRGAMPPKPTVVPIAIRKRRQMVNELIAMMRREGFVVTGIDDGR